MLADVGRLRRAAERRPATMRNSLGAVNATHAELIDAGQLGRERGRVRAHAGQPAQIRGPSPAESRARQAGAKVQGCALIA